MRILHISTRLILGGSQENTVLSCEGQARLGHEVHLAFGPIYGPEGSLLDRVSAFRTEDGRAITTHVVPDMVRQINPIKDWRATGQLKGLIGAIKPDIVHMHSSKAGIIGRDAAWSVMGRAGAPHPGGVIHTIHGPPFMPVEGGGGSRAAIRAKNWVYEVAERRAAGRCHVIVSVADAMTRQFLARGIGRPEQYVTVRSGMEVEPYLIPPKGRESRDALRRSMNLGEKDFVIGTVARLAQHKGHDDLLDALGDDLRAHRSWRLLWVGDGWWRDRLSAKARAMGLTVMDWDRPPLGPAGNDPLPDAQVILTGLVPPGRVPAMIRAMDVLAHPSYREGLPRTVPQALLSGVCPVAYDVDGTGEVCVDGQSGRLVRAGDLAGLREAIRWLESHPDERRAMGQRGRERCAIEFSTGAMVEGLEAVYARALGLARAGVRHAGG